MREREEEGGGEREGERESPLCLSYLGALMDLLVLELCGL